jgi:hypothetical protein
VVLAPVHAGLPHRHRRKGSSLERAEHAAQHDRVIASARVTGAPDLQLCDEAQQHAERSKRPVGAKVNTLTSASLTFAPDVRSWPLGSRSSHSRANHAAVPRPIEYPDRVRVRWVIAGMFAAIGVWWLAVMALSMSGVRSEWMRYGAHATAALAAGALMVAHAPLRPWREPAAAGTLAVVLLWVQWLGASTKAVGWLQPWPVALGVAALSGALAAAGGFAARRFAVAARTELVIALSVGVVSGVVFVVLRVTDFGLLSLLLGVLGGGFVTQAAVPSRRPVACGAGAAVFAVFPVPSDWSMLVWDLLNLPILVAIGYLGAVLAWRTLRNGDASSAPDVPPARLG